MKITFKKWNGQLVPSTYDDMQKLNSFADGAEYVIDIKNSDIRTIQQNKSIHLWCSQIAETLNNCNLPQEQILKAQIDWNMEKVKEIIFKPIVKALYGKDSTTKLNKNEFDKVIDTIVMTFANRGVSLPAFPTKG